MASDRLYGSICLTDIFGLMNGGHSSISKSEKNGKVYMNIVQWLNLTEPDQYEQVASIQPSCHKNASDTEKQATKKIYLGNLKLAKPEPLSTNDVQAAAAAFQNFGGAPAASLPNGNPQSPVNDPGLLSGPSNLQPLAGNGQPPVGNTGTLAALPNDGLPF